MADQTFLDMVKKLAMEIQGCPEKYAFVKNQCNGKNTFEELFSFIWDLEDAHRVLTPKLLTSRKSEKEADELRRQGNVFYKRKEFDKALELYNMSIMASPHPVIHAVAELCDNTNGQVNDEGSEGFVFSRIDPARYGGTTDRESKALAMGFANRSAIMYELEFHEKCLRDIKLALLYGYPKPLREKLEKRKENCLTRINNADGPEKELKPKSSLGTDDAAAKALSSLDNGSDLCELLFASMQISQQPEETSTIKQLLSQTVKKSPKLEPNQSVSSISSAVEVSFNPSRGRCLVAVRDIRPGEVLGVEEAYSVNLDLEKLHLYCATCLRLCLTPLPCPACSQVIYCSESCRTRGLARDHWLECRILPTMISLDLTKRNMVCKMLKTLSFSQLSDLLDNLQKEGNAKPEEEDLESVRKGFRNSTSYKAVYHLCSNKDLHSFEFIFMQCQITFVITKLLEQSGRFFVDNNGAAITPSREDIVKTGAVLLSHAIKLHCNPYQVMDLQLKEPIGAGMFPALSLINHSCYPTARHYSCGRELILRAIRPIATGEELTISYVPEFHKQEKDERCNVLKRYQFTCDCEACTNNWPTYADIPPLKFKCVGCRKPLVGKLRLCSECQEKNLNSDSKEEVEKLWNGVLKACAMDINLTSGISTSEKDFNFVRESTELLYKHVSMPCQHVLVMQNLLFKCFEDGM